MSFLTVSNVSKRGENGFELRPLSFVQHRFQRLAIAGETGSGKTTLLKIISNLIQAAGGEIRIEGELVRGPDFQLIPGHPRIAYLSQHYELRNNYRVAELLDMAVKLPENEAAAIYEVCRINHLLHRWTNQLSGGEKQRISVARLLAMSPRLLVLDEPFSNLDFIHKSILKQVIADAELKMGITCILSSHDPLDTLSWADEIMVLREGEVVQQAAPGLLYRQPADEYVAGLFGKYNKLTTELAASLFNENDAVPLMIRPEDFIIVSSGAGNSVQGIIESISFWGSYYELEVALAGTKILMRTMSSEYKKGDDVAVSVKANA